MMFSRKKDEQQRKRMSREQMSSKDKGHQAKYREDREEKKR